MRLRIHEFSQVNAAGNAAWFSELCFCLLTSNAKARTALAVQQELGYKGFSTYGVDRIRDSLLANKHRFHNVKASRIVRAREHLMIKDTLMPTIRTQGVIAAREWLVSNVHGFGYKEASHFLRNVGYGDLAILDRHIINIMADHKLIAERPKTIRRQEYHAIERIFLELASKANMTAAELDFYMWYIKAGDVLK